MCVMEYGVSCVINGSCTSIYLLVVAGTTSFWTLVCISLTRTKELLDGYT